jgi:hypothetical protein
LVFKAFRQSVLIINFSLNFITWKAEDTAAAEADNNKEETKEEEEAVAIDPDLTEEVDSEAEGEMTTVEAMSHTASVRTFSPLEIAISVINASSSTPKNLVAAAVAEAELEAEATEVAEEAVVTDPSGQRSSSPKLLRANQFQFW